MVKLDSEVDRRRRSERRRGPDERSADRGHELRGDPRAVGARRRQRRFFDLLWLTAVTEFKLGFHGTALGFLWSLLRPLLLFSVLLVVFTHIFRFGDAVKDYPALLLFNMMLFGFFQEATTSAGALGGRQRGAWSARCSSRAS